MSPDKYSPVRLNKIAEKMYSLIYAVKDPRSRKPAELTDLGRQLLAMTKIKQETIKKIELAEFEAQYPEADIAHLHYAHHSKRREKNLIKLQEQYRAKVMAERQ